MMRSFFAVSFFLVLGFPLFSQVVSYDSLKAKYPDESAVFTQDKHSIVINMHKDKLQVYSDYVSEIWFLKENAKSYSDQSMYYTSFSKISDINAYTLIPKGKPGKFKKEKVTLFQDNDIYSPSIFYNDNKKKTFIFPNAQQGGAGHLAYRSTYSDPRFIDETFYFNSYIPSMNAEFSVTYPSNVKISYTLLNSDKTDIKFSKTEKNGMVTCTWTARNLPPLKGVYNAPTRGYYAPHIILRIAEVEHSNGQTEKVFTDRDALYNWLYDLVKDVNSEHNQELQSLVDSLTGNIKSEDEKARAIFNWVQTNVKYVAFEDGMGGYIPRKAHMVCQKRYGDCKDMGSIITTMLKYAGLQGHLTWIGSRDIPYTFNENPTVGVINHMISAYKRKDGSYLFLDGVGSYTPYGFPTAFIQGKEALIESGLGKYDVVVVPIIPKEKNTRKDVVTMRIENNSIVGKGHIESYGYDKLEFFVYRLINKSNEKRTEALKDMLEKGSNKMDIHTAEFIGLENRDTNLVINYEFKLPDYCKVVGDEVYMNMNLEKDLKGNNLDIAKRKGIPYENQYKYIDQETNKLVVPAGYKVEYLPGNSQYKNDLFGFKISYQVVNNEVVMNKELYVDYLYLHEENFAAWNDMIKELNKAYSEVVILKKK
ncbi:MAG: transglutaminase-like domain-containing protein [Flavobacteriales bacterium]